MKATIEKRSSSEVIRDYRKIMDAVRNSEIMQKQWDNYQKNFEYSVDITFMDACEAIVQLMDSLIEHRN